MTELNEVEAGRTLFESLGATDSDRFAVLRAVASAFYRRVYSDSLLWATFADTPQERVEAGLVKTAAALLGHPGSKPADLRTVHARLNINPDVYWRTLAHLFATLDGFAVSRELAVALFAAVWDVRHDVRGERTRGTLD